MFSVKLDSEIVRNVGYKSDWIDFWTKTISLLPLSVFPTWILTTKHPLMSKVGNTRISR